MNAEERIAVAILRIRHRQPFFGVLALFAEHRLDPAVATAATDGKAVIFNPEFAESLSDAELDAVMVHELLHAALLHCPRRGERDGYFWNVAADIVVNGIIRQEPLLVLPAGACVDNELEHYEVEEVYEIIRDRKKQPKNGWIGLDLFPSGWPSQGDQPALPGGHLAADLPAQEAYWKQAWQQATMLADGSGRGTVPAGLKRSLHALTAPQLDWRSLMWRFLVRTPVDFSGFDVLHAHGDDWFLWGRKRPRHIHTYHGSCLAESGHQINFRERVRMLALAACEYGSLGLCDESVAVSEGTRVYIPGIRHVIPNGVELRQFYPSAEKADRPTCLFVGALQGRKRGKLLVELFQKEVLSELPNASLWAVCDEPVEGKGVEWFGRVSTALLCELYRRAWVFCLPSSYEGFGVPYIEAMASGTAVVATPNRGALEVLQNGTCGIISGEERLGRRLIQVLRDSRLREFLERKGLERAQSYGWDIVCRAYEALYRGESMSREVRESKELVV